MNMQRRLSLTESRSQEMRNIKLLFVGVMAWTFIT